VTAKKIILFELNEVPGRVLDTFVSENPRSALATLLAKGVFANTRAADAGHLSPWITWPTLHRGVNDTIHGLTSFGQPLDEVDRKYPPIWKLLAASGVTVGVFGSLHSYPAPAPEKNILFHVPDTFASSSECLPESVSIFQAFNLAMVAGSARNVAKSIPVAALAFLPKALSLGITLRSFGKISKQLASEIFCPWKRTRRRSFQAILGFDVFYRLICKEQPQFSTFFTNHVASAMHRYWAARYPEDFSSSDFDDHWRKRFSNEISWAMHCADELIQKLMDHCDERKDTILLITSSMGQAAHDARKVSTQLVLENPTRLLAALGVPSEHWEKKPAMVPQFNCLVSPKYEPILLSALKELTVNDKPVEFVLQPGGFFSISFGQINLSSENVDIQLGGKKLSLGEAGLSNLAIEDEAGSTAYHIHEGIFLWFDPNAKQSKKLQAEVLTTAIAPTLCEFFSIPIPQYMSPDTFLTEALQHTPKG
jgi:hypothetical protein